MTDSIRPASRALHAVLSETEPGLFRAEYTGKLHPDDPNDRQVSDFHIGTDAEGVKQWVEAMATGLGYNRVVWDEPDRA